MNADFFFSGRWAKWLILSGAQKAGLAIAAGSLVWVFCGGLSAATSFPGGGMPIHTHFQVWILPQLFLLGGLGLWLASTVAVIAAHRGRR